jgi:hypothetical protein
MSAADGCGSKVKKQLHVLGCWLFYLLDSSVVMGWPRLHCYGAESKVRCIPQRLLWVLSFGRVILWVSETERQPPGKCSDVSDFLLACRHILDGQFGTMKFNEGEMMETCGHCIFIADLSCSLHLQCDLVLDLPQQRQSGYPPKGIMLPTPMEKHHRQANNSKQYEITADCNCPLFSQVYCQQTQCRHYV